MAALNIKGIKEKSLHDNINYYLKHGILNSPQEAEKNQTENSTTSMKKIENSDRLSEILTTLISTQNPSEIKPERNTRGRPKKTPTQTKRHTLSLEAIVNKLVQTETYFSNYLTQRSSRWILEEKKANFVKK